MKSGQKLMTKKMGVSSNIDIESSASNKIKRCDDDDDDDDDNDDVEMDDR